MNNFLYNFLPFYFTFFKPFSVKVYNTKKNTHNFYYFCNENFCGKATGSVFSSLFFFIIIPLVFHFYFHFIVIIAILNRWLFLLLNFPFSISLSLLTCYCCCIISTFSVSIELNMLLFVHENQFYDQFYVLSSLYIYMLQNITQNGKVSPGVKWVYVLCFYINTALCFSLTTIKSPTKQWTFENICKKKA